MAATSSTTLAAAVTADANQLYVSSATGITAGVYLFIGGELIKVVSISGTLAKIIRGLDGTRVIAHASGEKVWICGVAGTGVIKANDPGGTATAAEQPYLPVVVPSTGRIWDVENGVWVEVDQDKPMTVITEGTPATGVSVYEYGEGRMHLTKLTFSDLTIGAIAGAADEAIGKLVYTFPAGVIKIKTAHINLGVDGTAALIDADTPDLGLGTVIATGAVAVLSGTATFENILTGQTMNNCTGTAEVKTVHSELVIEASEAHTVHLNVADGWAGADAGLKATGTISLEWVLLAT